MTSTLPTTDETWVPIPGLDGYEASSLGRIRSVERTFVNARGRRVTTGGCVRETRRYGKQKYASYTATVRGKRITKMVHSTVCEAFHGPRPHPGWHAAHEDGDVDNNTPENLTWKSPSENNLDTVRHGHHHLANRTHCPQRHQLVDPNLATAAKRVGRRKCLSCNRATAYAAMLKRDGKPAQDHQALSDRYYLALGFELETEVAA